jgi:hypothetical protein
VLASTVESKIAHGIWVSMLFGLIMYWPIIPIIVDRSSIIGISHATEDTYLINNALISVNIDPETIQSDQPAQQPFYNNRQPPSNKDIRRAQDMAETRRFDAIRNS